MSQSKSGIMDEDVDLRFLDYLQLRLKELAPDAKLPIKRLSKKDFMIAGKRFQVLAPNVR